MSVLIQLIAFFGVAFTSGILVNQVRKHALNKGIIDIPNERSSHKLPTPRGGGVGFVITFLASIIFLAFLNIISISIAFVLVVGGILVASMGWMDDKNGLNVQIRAVIQFEAAGWAVYCLGGFSSISIGLIELQLGWIGSVIAVVGTVWMINLYNFMDGLDGLAGTEAVSVAFICGAILLWQGYTDLSIVCFCLVASILGFLYWNWPPAKIFMGDIGSGFLGFIFAVLAMWSENSGAIPIIIWIMLLGVFVIDATVTLIKRIYRRERLSEAHRSHVYQLAVQAGYSHKQITLTVLLINIILGIIAILSLVYMNYMLVSIAVAIVLIGIHIILSRWLNNKIIRMHSFNQTKDVVVPQSYIEAAAHYDE